MPCEDFPCCGHEAGLCPDFDPETGEQLNMRCTCGARLPISSRSSICNDCLRDPGEDGDFIEDSDDWEGDFEFDDFDDENGPESPFDPDDRPNDFDFEDDLGSPEGPYGNNP